MRNENTNSTNNGTDQSNTDSSANFSAFVTSENYIIPGSVCASTEEISQKHGFLHAMDEKNSWILDSGASRHISCRREWFQEFTPCEGEYVYLGDDTKANVKGRGKVFIRRLVNNEWLDGVVNDVLYVPSFQKNLLSTGACMSNGYFIVFDDDRASIFSKDKDLLAQGVKQQNNLIKMLIIPVIKYEANFASNAPMKLWHERLGYVNCDRIQEMLRNDVVSGVSIAGKEEFFCENCPIGKQFKLPFKSVDKGANVTFFAFQK